MANWNDTDQRQGFGSVPRAGDAVARQETFDAGLRKHMLSIYNYMTSGVLLTGVVALLAAQSGLAVSFASGPLMWIVALAPLGFVLAMSFGLNKMSKGTLQILFWSFAIVMGLSMSTIFLRFTGESIAATFFATAGAFAGLSLYRITCTMNTGDYDVRKKLYAIDCTWACTSRDLDFHIDVFIFVSCQWIFIFCVHSPPTTRPCPRNNFVLFL